MSERVLVVLTLNEIEGVRSMLAELKAAPADEVVVVDGGSTDGTRELLEESGFRVVGQSQLGRGAAFRVGVGCTRGRYLVIFSPDGNEAIGDIPRLFERLEAGADMVIASRHLPESANEEDHLRFPWRKWANLAFGWLANQRWNRGRPYIADTINGFRGFTREFYLAVAPRSHGFTIEYELSIAAMRRGARVEEIPTIEGQRIGGVTKARSIPVGLRFLRFLIGELLRG